jgi:hypothetical protein
VAAQVNEKYEGEEHGYDPESYPTVEEALTLRSSSRNLSQVDERNWKFQKPPPQSLPEKVSRQLTHSGNYKSHVSSRGCFTLAILKTGRQLCCLGTEAGDQHINPVRCARAQSRTDITLPVNSPLSLGILLEAERETEVVFFPSPFARK